jgi:DNA processing protein
LYPRANLNLAHKIEQNGMLISEFKDQDQAKPYFFPQRNRLMAGIADLILVVEANEKSGSMITARLGTEYNREVATIPHSIFSDLSSGSHSLIRNGATLIRNGNDILEILGLRSEKEKGVKIFLETLEPLEKEIMLECQSEIILETLLTHLNKYPPKEIFEALSMLEIKGFIKMEIGQVIPCGILQK